MKEGLRKAADVVLWFLGGQTSRSLSRLVKKDKTAPPDKRTQPQQTFVSTSGVWYNQGSEVRSSSADLEQYEQVIELLDTRVLDDRGWLKCLGGVDVWQSMAKLEEADATAAERFGVQLSKRIFDLVSHFAAEYHDFTRQVISMTPPSDVNERIKSKTQSGLETTESILYNRWRASTASWALSCRARRGLIEIFLVPSSDLMALSQGEAPLRLKLRLELLKVAGRLIWTCDELPVSADDLRVLIRMFLRDLIAATQDQEQPVQSTNALTNVDDARLARSIEQLLIEREVLAQKVVIQQEEIQKRIARDLHDAVISDVMALKRNLSSDKAVPTGEVLSSLEVIVRKLREICYDLSPRDLSDWGLATVVDDMLEQMGQRTGIDCELNCEIDIPVMPAAVLLHIYRIIQESINNAEKYAEPSRVVVTMEMNGRIFVVTIADNGKGFEPDGGSASGRTGGVGMGSLKERADLIRCFYPTKFSLKSAPGKGTRVQLDIDLARF